MKVRTFTKSWQAVVGKGNNYHLERNSQDNAVDIPRDVVLGWKPGPFTNTLVVYLRGEAPAFLETSPGNIVMNLGQLARTIVTKAKVSGLSVLVCDTLEDTEIVVQYIEQLIEQDVDGMLVLPVGKQWDHIQRLAHNGLPPVVVDRIVPDVDCHCIGVDNYQDTAECL